jgi:hypothetical protein
MDELLRFLRSEVVPSLDRTAALLLVGSHAEGNANRASDIDLIGVVLAERRRWRIRKQELEVGGHVIGVDYLALEQLRRKIRDLDLVYRGGTYGFDAHATRIADGILVYDTDGVGQSLIAEARRYQPSVGTLHEIGRAALTFYQDALGSLDQGDAETAILMARQAATAAIDCFLLHRGCRSLKPKWHFRRLRKAGADNLVERYRRVIGLNGESDHLQAVRTFAELDRMLCEVLRIGDIRDFEDSPLWKVRDWEESP